MNYKELRNLIAEGDLLGAIDELRVIVEQSSSPNREEIFLQSFRLKDKLKDLGRGVISQNEADVLKAKVSQSVLKIIDELEKFENLDAQEKIENTGSTTNYYIRGDMVKGDIYKAKKITINKK